MVVAHPAPQMFVTTEFDLPCAECGHELQPTRVTAREAAVTVADCPNCGGRYYPEDALGRL